MKGKEKFTGSLAVVVSRFNEFISQRLLTACLQELKRRGLKENHIKIVWVPGSFEIPLVALRFARQKHIDGVIGLGAVIRGETFHYELVARAVADGISQVALLTGKPVIFGVLATDTVEQAQKRSQEKGDNKGREAAVAVLDMIEILREIREKK